MFKPDGGWPEADHQLDVYGHLDRRADAAETVALIELEPIGDSCSFRL